MIVTSSAFLNGERIPPKFTADGENVNPPLTISEIPEGTMSLILTVEDPDSKKVAGYTWVHWIVFDIPARKRVIEIEENSIPGTAGESTYKKHVYGGPNPPKGSGVHHYHFRVYAVDEVLGLPPMASWREIEEEMEDKVLAEAELVGKYSRD
jgi:Raf kinase inhibitor-like YbhB/YbcL family protein